MPVAFILGACDRDPVAPEYQEMSGVSSVVANQLISPGLTAGGLHTCALKTDGTVICWGDDQWGQSTVPAGLTVAEAVSAGGSHTCALNAGGTVTCWGYNGYGDPPAGLAGVSAVSAGGAHTCALKTDGTVSCWGYNGHGQTSVPAGLAGVAAVSSGSLYTCVLKIDGTVLCWGQEGDQLNPPTGLSGVAAVSSGFHHVCALKADSTVTCWGSNFNPGFGFSGQATVPEGLTAVAAVSAGLGAYTCVVKTEGTVTCWGEDAGGQPFTAPAGLSGVEAVSGGEAHVCALKTDGTATCWGDDGRNTPPAGLNLITQQSQAITFTSTPPSPVVLGASYAVAATGGGSTNPVAFSSLTPGTCTVAGNVVSFAAVGICTLAADQAGSAAYAPAPQETQQLTIVHPFTGFFQPVDNTPAQNKAKAGSAIPIKFSLGADQGLDIFVAQSPTQAKGGCPNTVTDVIEETLTAGSSGLSYDPVTTQYTYVWKTEKAWADTCRYLMMELRDGTTHSALFVFTK